MFKSTLLVLIFMIPLTSHAVSRLTPSELKGFLQEASDDHNLDAAINETLRPSGVLLDPNLKTLSNDQSPLKIVFSGQNFHGETVTFLLEELPSRLGSSSYQLTVVEQFTVSDISLIEVLTRDSPSMREIYNELDNNGILLDPELVVEISLDKDYRRTVRVQGRRTGGTKVSVYRLFEKDIEEESFVMTEEPSCEDMLESFVSQKH